MSDSPRKRMHVQLQQRNRAWPRGWAYSSLIYGLALQEFATRKCLQAQGYTVQMRFRNAVYLQLQIQGATSFLYLVSVLQGNSTTVSLAAATSPTMSGSNSEPETAQEE